MLYMNHCLIKKKENPTALTIKFCSNILEVRVLIYITLMIWGGKSNTVEEYIAILAMKKIYHDKNFENQS